MNFSVYLGSLLLKNQYYKLKELLELPKYNFKERYKVLWFTLMTLMQDEFPNEIKKMGSEFEESVDEVLKEIEKLKKEDEAK